MIDAKCHEAPSLRVLVVNDNVEAARGLEVLLTKQGFEVAIVLDGASCVAAALAVDPDAVLLDLTLGAVTGYDVARRLRAEPRLARTRLLALTGFDHDTDRERADDLVKPVVLEDLLATLAS
jgi:CheY-like chemotaxis protein